MPNPDQPEPFGMVAEHTMQPNENTDGLRLLNGMTVRVTQDEHGVAIFHITARPDQFLWVLYNNETIFDYTPDDGQRQQLADAIATAEPPPAEQQIRDAVQARLAAGDTVGVTTTDLVVQEAAKLVESATATTEEVPNV